jgi:ABC-type multidrug transport system fused ATPase/permease subunit
VLATRSLGGKKGMAGRLPLVGPTDKYSVAALVLAGIALAVVRAAAFGVAAWISGSVSADYEARTRSALFVAFSHAPWPVQEQQRAAAFQDILTTDVESAQAGVADAADALTASVSVLLMLVLAFVVNPVAGGLVIFAGVVLAALLRPLSLLTREVSRQRARLNSEWTNELSQSVSQAREVHVFGAAEFFAGRMGQIQGEIRKARVRNTVAGSLVPVLYQTAVLVLATSGLGLIYGINRNLLLTAGPTVLFLLRVMSYGQIVQQKYHGIREHGPFMERTEELLTTLNGERDDAGTVQMDSAQSLQLHNISYVYPTGVRALCSVSAVCRVGELIGVVGPSGSGKSTLAQILLRLRRASSGSYHIDGVPVQEITRRSWTRLVSFVPQEPVLFYGTIAENIRFGRPLPDDDIRAAATAAMLIDEVEAMPNGFDEIVGDRGQRLSGGQRQRVCIARAIAADPTIVVLDEPTSSLDPRSEAAIRESLLSLKNNRCVFVIAHRRSTIAICDRVLVLSGGRLEAFGQPQIVQESSAYYRDFVTLP